MKKLIAQEDKITFGGAALPGSDTQKIKTLSLCMGEDIVTTCDRRNVLLQTLSDVWETLKDLGKRILEVLAAEKEDICESCIGRRTRHGSSIRAGEPKQAKANIKWQEKYRPP